MKVLYIVLIIIILVGIGHSAALTNKLLLNEWYNYNKINELRARIETLENKRWYGK